MRGRAAERTENTPTGPIFLRVLAKIRRDSAKLIVAQARSDALAGLSGTRALTLLFTLLHRRSVSSNSLVSTQGKLREDPYLIEDHHFIIYP